MDWVDQGLCENYNILYPSEWGTSRVDSPYQRSLPGDPLSPFLFLLCTKGLHGLIQQAARVGYKGHLPMLQRTRTNPFIVYR